METSSKSKISMVHEEQARTVALADGMEGITHRAQAHGRYNTQGNSAGHHRTLVYSCKAVGQRPLVN